MSHPEPHPHPQVRFTLSGDHSLYCTFTHTNIYVLQLDHFILSNMIIVFGKTERISDLSCTSVPTDRSNTLTKNGYLVSIKTLCSSKTAGFKFFRRQINPFSVSTKFSQLNHCRTNHRKSRSILARNLETHLHKSTNYIILGAGATGLMRLFNGSQYSEL